MAEETKQLSIFEGAEASKILAFTPGWEQQILGAIVVLLVSIHARIK